MLPSMHSAAPAMPVYSNCTGEPYRLDECARWLSAQVCHPVRWQQIIEHMAAQGVDIFLEFGPGTTLAGLVKRTLADARTASVCDPESLSKCLDMLGQEGGR